MPVQKPRNRLVNFRLNEEEYEGLRAACAHHGARSVSDFARAAVLRSAGIQERADRQTQRRLSDLGQKVSELEAHVQDLMRLIAGSDGAGAQRRS
jgi:hypothetical protein